MPKLLIAGEAWGEEEERQNAPFVGPSGKLLHILLRDAGLPKLRHTYVTNVFNLRPKPRNDIKNLCGPKAEGMPHTKPLAPGKYILPQYWPEVERFRDEVVAVRPNLVLALGNTPLWALVKGRNAITNVRGTVMESFLTHPDGTPIKVLPTFHPAAMLREWKLRPIIIADMVKASREMEFPEIRRPSRTLWIEPTNLDIWQFIREHIKPRVSEPWGVDIETISGTITEISFCRPDIGIVVPFYSREAEDGNYWETPDAEREAWEAVRAILSMLERPVFQNGLYDINYLWRTINIKVQHAGEDTMLLHHALLPGMKKSLGFLGSIYTDEPSWKLMRDKSTDNFKLED